MSVAYAAFFWDSDLGYSCLGSSGRTHKPVVGSSLTFHTIMCLKITLHLLVSYSTFHPASHSILMVIRDVWASTGTIWAIVAASGSQVVSIEMSL